jgi:hypothetical protein
LKDQYLSIKRALFVLPGYRILGFSLGILMALPVSMYAAHCQTESLLHQRKDVLTIDRLEEAWTLAYLRGDSDLERCILAPDFTEILRNGEIKFLQDELKFAESNRGKQLPIPRFVKGTVLLHGNVAVAYGKSISKSADGSTLETRYADYYVWKAGLWHAFFAQQTGVPKDNN